MIIDLTDRSRQSQFIVYLQNTDPRTTKIVKIVFFKCYGNPMLPIILCTIDIRLSYFIFVTCAIGDAADDDVVPLLSILVQSPLSRTRPIIPNEQLLYSYKTCYLLIFAARFRANRSRTHRALTQSRLP